MRPALLPALSGLLLALSLPPFPPGPLAAVALVPLALFVASRAPDGPGAASAVAGGILGGGVHHAVVLHWLALSLPGRPWTGLAAFLVVASALALLWGLAALLLHRAIHRWHAPVWLALPAAWTAVEWLRAHLPAGFAFPWGGLALAFHGQPWALAPVAWVGERGVAFWVALVNGLVAGALLGWSRAGGEPRIGAGPSPWKRRAPLAAGALAAAGLPLAFAAVDGPSGGGRVVRVAVLQTAVGTDVRRDPQAGADAMAAALDRLLAELAPASVDLVVLPETAFPVPLESASGSRYLEELERHAARLGAPLVVGALGWSEGRRSVHNSLFAVEAGGVSGRYDKRRLVPGVERAPLVPSALLAALDGELAYEAGGRAPPLSAGTLRLATLICYEAAFGALAREHLGAGAGLIVNATNDAWFPAGARGAAARAQHEAHLVIRALEARTWAVRSANGGASLAVDPGGAVHRVAAPGEEGVAVVVVRWASAPTPFIRGGDAVGPACALAALLLLVGAPGGSRRGGGPEPTGAGDPTAS